jgi:hypothetical protein
MMNTALTRITARYPAVEKTVRAILRLDDEICRLPITQFFEPASVVENSGGKQD